MRILQDLSIFANRTAKQSKRTSGSVIYHDGVQFRYDSLHGQSDMPLGCQMFCHSTLRDFLFQRRVRQEFLSLEYIYSGELYLRSGLRGWVAEAGDFCLLHPGRDTDLLFLPEQGECRKFGMILSGPLLGVLLERLNLNEVFNVHFSDSHQVDEIAERLWRSLCPDSAAAAEYIGGCLFELLTLLSRSCTRPMRSERVVQICAELESRLSEKISMYDLAQKYHMSLPYFNQVFSEAMQQTPYQYLIQRRMAKGVNLLRNKELRIKEIALRCGYADPLHFSTEFRRLHGCAPREFRKRMQ